MLFDFFLLHDCWESSHFSGWLNANKVRANKIAYTILIVEQNVAAFLCCLKSLILMFLTNKCDQGEKTCLEFWNVNYLLSQESMNCWSVVRWLIWQETQALSQTGDRAISKKILQMVVMLVMALVGMLGMWDTALLWPDVRWKWCEECDHTCHITRKPWGGDGWRCLYCGSTGANCQHCTVN